MKQYLNLYLNWRLHIIAALAILAIITAADEADRTPLAFLAIKAAAACLMLTAYCLAKYWHAKGHFRDIDNYCNEQ